MDIFQRIERGLRALRARIRKIHNTLQRRAETEHIGEKVEGCEDFPRQPVRAIVSFDDETIRRTQAEGKSQHETQESIKKAAWAAVIAATGYAFISAAMWCQMIRQNRIASAALRQSTESFRIDERAWIELEAVKGTMFTPRTGKFGASFKYPIVMRNFGRTVARNIQLRATRNGSQSSVTMEDNEDSIKWIQDKLLMGEVPSASDIPISNPVPKVIAPNTSSPVPLILNGQEPQYFTKDEWVSYLIGRIDYTDAFGVPHWVKFCFFVADSQGNLWNCKQGNDEDTNPEGSATPN